MDAEMVDVTGGDDEVVVAPEAMGADEQASVEVEGPTAEAVQHDIEALLAERDQFKDIAQRLQADFENYRRRQQANQSAEVDRATGRLVDDLLAVLDACELGYAHGVEGIEPIWSALLGTLQRHGLEPLDLQGQPFDPSQAEAVIHEPGGEASGEPVVAEVLRTGYRWKGQVLRPAMVKVKG